MTDFRLLESSRKQRQVFRHALKFLAVGDVQFGDVGLGETTAAEGGSAAVEHYVKDPRSASAHHARSRARTKDTLMRRSKRDGHALKQLDLALLQLGALSERQR